MFLHTIYCLKNQYRDWYTCADIEQDDKTKEIIVTLRNKFNNNLDKVIRYPAKANCVSVIREYTRE